MVDRRISETHVENDHYYAFDTESEVDEYASEAVERISEEEKDIYEVSIGLITEDDLERCDDWESFKSVGILTTLKKSNVAHETQIDKGKGPAKIIKFPGTE